MVDLAVIGAWAEFALRWLHVVVAIAWIGSSFYFIALDLGLRRGRCSPDGADGEQWQVHGGGFYHIQKYLVAPSRMPDELIWFKWESYATWLSGFVLMAVIYYVGAEFYLIDPAVADISPWAGIAISIVSLGVGWLAYDQLCRRLVAVDQGWLMLMLFAVLLAVAWFYAQVFAGRAALLHLGAFTATIMTGNVFLIIIPNQKIVVSHLVAGQEVPTILGKVAKQRSTHNNYLTLPVIFLMLANHYPLSFAGPWNWLIGCLVFLMGVCIRHFFNSMHARKGRPYWGWAAAALIFLVIIWLSSLDVAGTSNGPHPDEVRKPSISLAEHGAGKQAARYMAVHGFDEISDIIVGRCAMCHAKEPTWPGLYWPPKGIRLETPIDIARNARQIYLQTGLTTAMPPANLSWMEQQERDAIVSWYRRAVR